MCFVHTYKGDFEIMKLKVSYGLTINTGNYESERIDVSEEWEIDDSNGSDTINKVRDDLFRELKEWVCKKCKEEKTEPKECSDCRKYETKECPPWPVKGPDHWCTQYEAIDK